MALTSQQIADILFKKVATGKADSGSLPFAFFEESINANKSTISKDYWVDAPLIPNVNPLTSGTHGQTLGVIRVVKTLLLDWIPGTFAFTHAELKDVIPFNFGTNGSYNYQLYLNNGTTVIPMGTNDWYLDPEGGVLTFFNGGSPAFPTGVNSTSLRPRITCWTYIGAKNNPVLTLNESSAGAVADTYVLDSDLRYYSPNIVYVVKFANTNTGTSTININSLGAKDIKKNDDGNLVDVEADDIKAGVNYILVYDADNDIFQVASGAGGSGNASLKIIDIDSTDWVFNSGIYEYDILNYTVLGFKEIGSVQLWTQISGNDFELTSVDFEVNRFTKQLRIRSLTNPVSQLRVMGGGKVDAIASSSGEAYLNDLADVVINNNTLNTGDTLIFDGTNWVNGDVIPSTILTDNQMFEGGDVEKLSYIRKGLLLTLEPQQNFIEVEPSVEATPKAGVFDNYNGNGWIGTKQGVVELNYTTLNTTLHSYPSTTGFGNSTASNVINDIKFQSPDNSNVLLSTEDGVIIWDRFTNTFSTVSNTSGVVKFFESWGNDYDYNPEVYFATDKGILLYNTNTTTEQLYNYPNTPGFGTSGNESNYFLSINPDYSNGLFCAMTGDDGTNGGYLLTYDLNTSTFSTYCYPTTPGFGISNNSNFVNSNKCVLRDFSGIMWMATKDGLIRKTGASTFTTFSYPSDFGNTSLSNDITCISTDNSGNVWFGTKNGEAISVDGSLTFTTYTFPGFTEMYDCDRDGAYITFIGDGGVVRIDVFNLPNYTIIPVSGGKSVFALMSAYPNSVVVGTSTNVMKLDNKIKGTINIKTSVNTHTFTIDNSANSPDIQNDFLSSYSDYLNEISNFIDSNYGNNEFITEIVSNGVKNELIIYRVKVDEGVTQLISDETVKFWVDADLITYGDIKYINFENDYQSLNFITPPTSEPSKSNFGVSYKPKPGSSVITRFVPVEYYFDYTNDEWIINEQDLTPYTLKPSSYTTNNLLIMNPSGNQLVDAGINLSIFGNKYHKILFVDPVNGNDGTAQKGAILKPYQSLGSAFANAVAGDLIFLMPGTHNGGGFTGLPLGNGIDYYFLNAEVTFTGYAGLMGPISSTTNITCKLFGKGSFRRTNNSTPDNGQWALITPYVAGLNMDIDGIDFYCGNYPFIGALGQLDNGATAGDGSYIYTKKFNIKNSRIECYNNNIPPYVGAGNMPPNVQLTLENCYFKGLLMAGIGNPKNYPYCIKATNTTFEAVSNPNTLNYNITFLDYYDNADNYKAIFQRCTFKSEYGSLWIGNGYGGSGGTNKHLYIYDCKFTNDSQGWIVNETAGVDYKLINNWSENSNTGTFLVTNLLSGSGFIVDSGLELF